MPAGIVVELVAGAPTVFRFWYMRSWNSARLFLKPVVFTLARLLAITSMFNCCDCIPEAAVHKALIIVNLLYLLYPAQIVGRLVGHLVEALDRFHATFILAASCNQGYHLHQRLYIGVLQFPLPHHRSLGSLLGHIWPVRHEQGAPCFLQPVRLGEIEDAQGGDLLAVHGDFALIVDLYLP